MIGERLVEVIDFEKDCMPISFERTEVVFAIWVVGVAEVVIDGDGLDDPGDGLGPKGGDASGHHGMASGKIGATRH